MMLVIAIDRDSVHAGDDLSRHASSITLDPSATLRALFEAIRTMHYLPSISGDDASWIICASGKQMGVLAQQWSAPRLTVPIESLLKQVFGDHEPLSRIEAGEVLSSRY